MFDLAKALVIGQPVASEWLRWLKMTRKKSRSSKIFSSSVERPETEVFSLRHQAEVIGRLGFESYLAVGREELKTTARKM